VKHNHLLNILLILGILIASLACKISFGDSSSDNDAEKLKIQLTVQALQTIQTLAAAQAAPPAAEQQPPAQQPQQQQQAPQPTITVNPTPCNASHMTGETIPDGSSYDKGDPFTKTWTLRNDGSCTWTTDYRFVFIEGDRMDADASIHLPTEIDPGEKYTFNVDMVAPDENGEFTGVWRMKAPNGDTFGNYWVTIYVGPTPAPFSVTRVTYYMPHTTIDTGCPNDINVKAEITSSAAGKVTYKWKDSEGGSSSTKSVTFDEAGKKIVEYNVTVSSSGDKWAKIYIDSPNHQWFDPIEFHVNCT
jgi:hypothetical protein